MTTRQVHAIRSDPMKIEDMALSQLNKPQALLRITSCESCDDVNSGYCKAIRSRAILKACSRSDACTTTVTNGVVSSFPGKHETSNRGIPSSFTNTSAFKARTFLTRRGYIFRFHTLQIVAQQGPQEALRRDCPNFTVSIVSAQSMIRRAS